MRREFLVCGNPSHINAGTGQAGYQRLATHNGRDTPLVLELHFVA